MWSSPCCRGRRTTWRIRRSQARVLGPIHVSTLLDIVCPRESHHCAVCDQTDKGVLWQQAQAHDDRVLERLQAVLLLARVHDEQEDRGRGGRARQAVLDGGAAGVELWGDLLGGDVLVVRREGVALQTEGAYPHPRAHINLAEAESAEVVLVVHVGALPEGVEDGLARRLASNGVILQERSVRLLLQGRVESSDGDNQPRCFLY